MNILVTGSNGQLGSEIKNRAQDMSENKFFFTDAAELNICSKEAVLQFITVHHIDTIVNCAAYTAVDKAESEPEIADKINHIAVKEIAEIAGKRNIRLVHISTDYVFDGKGYKPYPTDHPTHPVNLYGKTKHLGEEAMKKQAPDNSIIIRTSWVYSSFGNNFVKTMIRLGREKDELNVINDQVGAPTYAGDLAEFILEKALVLEHKGVKVYHFTNEGVCSWFDFAREIMLLARIDCKVIPIPTSSYPTPAKRPYYSLLDKSELKTGFDFPIPYWKDSLAKCIKKLAIAAN